MAYIGKEFVVDREENYEAFIKSLALPEELSQKYIGYKPSVKVEKNGDKYTVKTVSGDGERVVTFESGVSFEDSMGPATFQTTYTVDGDTITQEITKDDKSVTFKREYTDNELKVTITASFFDGVAVRYYKAV